MLIRQALSVLAAAALLAGCSSPSPPVVLPPDPPSTVFVDPDPTPRPVCTTAQLAITEGKSESDNPGIMDMHWVFTNRGGECYTRGWPTVVFTDDQGRTVYTADHDDAGALAGYTDRLIAPVVRLHTGDKANVFWQAIESSSETCKRSTHIRLTPPEADGWAYAPDPSNGYDVAPGWWCRPEVGLMTAGSSNGY